MAKAPVRGFISYARTDNAAFDGIVDRLKSELEGKFFAQTGRTLDLFIDREAIGWGEDWRDKITESVRSAVVFIPVVSQAFFQSDGCREELLAFTATAEDLGVTDLILPIVIAGVDRITADHDQDEVRLIERLNYKSVEKGYLDGYDSSEWRRKLHEMVMSLEQRLESAEARLEQLEASTVGRPSGVESTSTGDTEPDYDVFSLTEDLERLTEETNEAMQKLLHLSEVVSESGLDLNTGSAAQKRANFTLLANQIHEPASETYEAGRDLERRVNALDPQLRGILQAMDSTLMQEQRQQLLTQMQGLSELRPVLTQLEGVVGILQMVGVVSISMKKALSPAINGIRSIRSALETVDSWRSM